MLQPESVLGARRQVRGREREENENLNLRKLRACGLVGASLRERIPCVVGFHQCKEAQARFRIGLRSQAPGNAWVFFRNHLLVVTKKQHKKAIMLFSYVFILGF